MGTNPRNRRGVGISNGRSARRLILAALVLGLGACSPVEGYRNLTGASKNDPNPATTPNTKNLAAGEAAAYPNLATVPPPPTQALTTAELDKLTKSLIADRTNAKYTSERLQAGFSEGSASAPPPPPAPPAAAESTATAPPAGAAPAPAGAAPAAGAAPGIAAAAPAGEKATGAKAAAATGAGAAAAKGPRKAGEPPEPGPVESSLQSPQIASLPQAQQVQPPPPPPRGLRLPSAPAASGAPAASAHLPPPPAPAPLPSAIGSAKFEPPPPPPSLPPPAPSQVAAARPPGKTAKPAAAVVATPVAEIDFAGDTTTLSEADRQTLAKVAPRYRQNPGKVRVVGYAGVGAGAVEQLNGYRLALDRAEAVAAALAKTGIPADKIATEAAPAGTDSGRSRTEILLEH